MLPLGAWVYISKDCINYSPWAYVHVSHYNMDIHSHWAYKSVFNGTVLILPLDICVRILIAILGLY